jgi:hypothetical protein
MTRRAITGLSTSALGPAPALMLALAVASCANSEGGPRSGTAGSNGGAGAAGAGGGTPGAGGAAGDAGTAGNGATTGTAGTTTGAGGRGGAAGSGGSGGSAGATGSGGGAGSVGAGGRGGNGGTAGAGGSVGAGGRGGAAGSGTAGSTAGATGTAGRGGGGGGGGGGSGSTGSAGTSGGGACAPCGTHRWACWPMPNPASAGQPNPASYKDNGDGTIMDNVTCLTWQKASPTTTYTVTDGRAYCATLGTGWRLATRVEMASIDDFTLSGAKAPAPFTGAAAFFKTGSEWVLTTKQIGAGAGTDYGWAYNFSDGIVSNARSGATADRVRCVRGNGDDAYDTAPGALAVAPPNQYTVVATGEVRDNYTGLVWQQDFSTATMAWTDAAGTCAGLTTGGHTWRVPSIRELATLVDEAQVAPAINRTMFPGTKSGSKSNNWYWASHLAAGNATAAWAINFDDGFTGFNAGASGAWNYFTAAWVRCVR